MNPYHIEVDKPVYLVGDHHGFIGELLATIEDGTIHDATLLHVGDGEEGISFFEPQFVEMDRAFARKGIVYLGMRGNHCDPALFDGRINLTHYKLVPDYTRLQVGGKSWLLVGGATSIDRLDRVRGIDWWPEEKFRLCRNLADPADVLVTHSGPRWIGPPSSNDFVDLYARCESEANDTDLIGELDTERMLHEELFRLVRPKHWYLGHFHCSESVVHEGCKTRILNICEVVKHPS